MRRNISKDFQDLVKIGFFGNQNPLTSTEQKRLDELEKDYENLDLLECAEYRELMKKVFPTEESLQ